MASVSRRAWLVAGLGLACRRQAAAETGWQGFRRQFLAPEGRIIDTGNNGVSHSEGQGTGLLLAALAGDRPGFEAMLAWTRRCLLLPGQPLHAWRWQPRLGVTDPNNASDGDLLIAWALLLAAERWGEAGWQRQAVMIGRAVLDRCTQVVAGRLVLLPGAVGFSHAGHVTLNPSYYHFPALAALAAALPDGRWGRLQQDALWLLDAGRFGPWRLPPDWLRLTRDGALSPAPEWPRRFSWDAVRVPLHLVWGGHAGHAAVGAALDFWLQPDHPAPPAWASLQGPEVASFAAGAGVQAILRLGLRQRLGSLRTDGPAAAEAASYYEAALVQFADIAQQCLPAG